MRRFLLATALIALGATSAWMFSAQAAPVSTNTVESTKFTRACVFAAGGWTIVDCSAAAAYSAALTSMTRYVVQATGGNAYIAWATAGSGQDADSNDGYLPAGAWVEMLTPTTAQYLTCDGSAASAKVRYIECQ